MEKKIILVTGASSGLGKQTALALAKQGYRVIIHGRDVEKTKRVYAQIKADVPNACLDMYTADLSLMSEVKKFADSIAANYSRLDVLVNNAGAQFGDKRQVTAEGHEKTLAINTLSPFLLTNLLLPLLEKSESARIITVSSESYRQGGQPILDDIELENHYSLSHSYAFSKLYVWWLMRQFDERLRASCIKNITVNTVEPGSAFTSLSRESLKSSWFMLPLVIIWLPMMRTAKYGARTSIYMASSPEVEGVSGKFYGNCKEKRINSKWINPAGEKTIWDFCQNACTPYLEPNAVLKDI